MTGMRNQLPTELAVRLGALKPVGDGWSAKCPAHEDSKPSLGVKVTDEGKVLLKCYAECAQDAIIAALDLPGGVLTPGGGGRDPLTDEWTPRGPAIAIYDYRDEKGTLLFQVLRTADKQFPLRRPDPATKSGWKWNLGDTERVPYRLPELLEAIDAGRPVWCAEGEKDVEALRRAGVAATCNPGGAGKWREEFSHWLGGADVTIVADKDKPGQAHARSVATALETYASTVRIVEAAGKHKDAAAHLGAGGTLADFVTTRDVEAPAEPDLAPGIHEFLDGPIGYSWQVPGLLERGDRVVFTGFEGFGKTYVHRQLAVAFAAGIHPFTNRQFTPLKVLFIDCENSELQTRRHFMRIAPVAARLGRPLLNDNLRIIVRPEGVDLTKPAGADWFFERVTAHKPDVIFIGSLYKLHERDPKDEPAARALAAVFDHARMLGDWCSLIIEAHAGHGGANAPRSPRPIGSSLWMRWPEYGIGLAPYAETDGRQLFPVEIAHWRGARNRDEAGGWPRYITHGRYDRDSNQFLEWPWVEHTPAAELGIAPATRSA